MTVTVRFATLDDIPLLVKHRRRMYEDMFPDNPGKFPVAVLDA